MGTFITVLLVLFIGGAIISFVLKKIKSIISFAIGSIVVSTYHIPNILDVIKKWLYM